LTERAWSEAVIKPAVSASAHRTWRARLADAPRLQPRLDAALAEGDVLVQRFEPAIRERGEWSLVFFGGRFSHGVIKRPRSDDFRVQEEHGGTAQPAVAPPDLVRQGRRILDEIEGPWLYARVDGIESDGLFTLLELELVEPVLFLAQDPRAAARFAEALETLLCRSEEARPPRIAGTRPPSIRRPPPRRSIQNQNVERPQGGARLARRNDRRAAALQISKRWRAVVRVQVPTRRTRFSSHFALPVRCDRGGPSAAPAVST
jgi:hypothetical protein